MYLFFCKHVIVQFAYTQAFIHFLADVRMNRHSSPFKRRQCGQGMMEYVIIVALIAVAAIGIYSAFGRTARVQTAGMAQEVAGIKASTENATDASNAAAGRANDPKKSGMGQYNYSNDQK
jgi:Flp pilus assembly pilin Flp